MSKRFGDRKSLAMAKNHPKPSQEFREQIGPFLHKMKGFSKISHHKVHPKLAKNLGRQILGNTFSGPKRSPAALFQPSPKSGKCQITWSGRARTSSFMFCPQGWSIMGVAWGCGASKPGPSGWGNLRAQAAGGNSDCHTLQHSLPDESQSSQNESGNRNKSGNHPITRLKMPVDNYSL